MSEDQIAKMKERWLEEHKCMQELNIPYIVRGVKLNDAAFLKFLNTNHAWSPLPVIVMEYCNGGDLRQHLTKPENTNGLTEFEVRAIMRALRNAIKYLHQHRVEHRDIKPENVLIHQIGRERCYKLTDFGFARETPEVTVHKSVVGTRNYFAPEVVLTSKYTNTIDYWSFGVVCFEIMCGTQPFIPHKNLFEIIDAIKRKSESCIAITDIPFTKDTQEHTKIFPETRMSRVFCQKIENWLRLALDNNYKTRGTTTKAPDEAQNPSNAEPIQFYRELDLCLDTKVLSVFYLNTSTRLSYEVTSNMNLTDLLASMELDTGYPRGSFFLIFPTGHPRTKIPQHPQQYFVEDWQDTSDPKNPPAMIYLLAYQCEWKPRDPQLSEIIKKCLHLEPAKPQSAWLVQKFAKHTHFTLSDEQSSLEALLNGLQEYALTVENEMIHFSPKLRTLLNDIQWLRGAVEQFALMIHRAKETFVQQKQTPKFGDFWQRWLTDANQFSADINELVHVRVGQSVERRFNSALTRAKQYATSTLYADLVKQDIYGLANFRLFMSGVQQNFNAEVILDKCQATVFTMIQKRAEYLRQLDQTLSEILDVHEEFRKVNEIATSVAQKYLAECRQKISNKTFEFMHALKTIIQADSDTSQKLTLKTDGTAGKQINGLCREFASLPLHVLAKPTSELIAETNLNIKKIQKAMEKM